MTSPDELPAVWRSVVEKMGEGPLARSAAILRACATFEETAKRDQKEAPELKLQERIDYAFQRKDGLDPKVHSIDHLHWARQARNDFADRAIAPSLEETRRSVLALAKADLALNGLPLDILEAVVPQRGNGDPSEVRLFWSLADGADEARRAASSQDSDLRSAAFVLAFAFIDGMLEDTGHTDRKVRLGAAVGKELIRNQDFIDQITPLVETRQRCAHNLKSPPASKCVASVEIMLRTAGELLAARRAQTAPLATADDEKRKRETDAEAERKLKAEHRAAEKLQRNALLHAVQTRRDPDDIHAASVHTDPELRSAALGAAKSLLVEALNRLAAHDSTIAHLPVDEKLLRIAAWALTPLTFGAVMVKRALEAHAPPLAGTPPGTHASREHVRVLLTTARELGLLRGSTAGPWPPTGPEPVKPQPQTQPPQAAGTAGPPPILFGADGAAQVRPTRAIDPERTSGRGRMEARDRGIVWGVAVAFLGLLGVAAMLQARPTGGTSGISVGPGGPPTSSARVRDLVVPASVVRPPAPPPPPPKNDLCDGRPPVPDECVPFPERPRCDPAATKVEIEEARTLKEGTPCDERADSDCGYPLQIATLQPAEYGNREKYAGMLLDQLAQVGFCPRKIYLGPREGRAQMALYALFDSELDERTAYCAMFKFCWATTLLPKTRAAQAHNSGGGAH